MIALIMLILAAPPPVNAEIQNSDGVKQIDQVILNKSYVTFHCADSIAVKSVVPHGPVKIYTENNMCNMTCGQYIYTRHISVKLIQYDSVRFCDEYQDCFAIDRGQVDKIRYLNSPAGSDYSSAGPYSHSQDSIDYGLRDRPHKTSTFNDRQDYSAKDMAGGVVFITVVMLAIYWATQNVDIDFWIFPSL